MKSIKYTEFQSLFYTVIIELTPILLLLIKLHANSTLNNFIENKYTNNSCKDSINDSSEN